jgi:hypothetical protein
MRETIPAKLSWRSFWIVRMRARSFFISLMPEGFAELRAKASSNLERMSASAISFSREAKLASLSSLSSGALRFLGTEDSNGSSTEMDAEGYSRSEITR